MMFLKPARKVYYQMGNHLGELFDKNGWIYYHSFYYDDNGHVKDNYYGTVHSDLVSHVPLMVGQRFALPPIQGADEKPKATFDMQDVITKTFLETWHAMNPPPPPAPPASDRPTRDSSRKHYDSEKVNMIAPFEWLWRQLLRLIDWLNAITGADKPKSKQTSEQMATLGELFEGHGEILPEPSEPSLVIRKSPRPGQPPGNTSTTRRR